MPHNYNSRNAHHRDCLLNFDEINHKYTIDGKDLISVTTLIENCFEKFDADYWAAKKAPKMGITADELKARWEANAQQARDLGTAMHDKIEKYYMFPIILSAVVMIMVSFYVFSLIGEGLYV